METIKIWLKQAGNYALTKGLPALLLLMIGIVVITVLRRLIKKILKGSKLEKAAHSLIISVVTIVLYLLLALIVASSLGINVTGAVALVSVLTLAVSLAVQNMLANILGGITLLTTDPFDAGDYVEIAGKAGKVKEVGLTYTKLTTTDNKEISIPNNSVVSSEIVNYSANNTRRIEIYVSASYGSPIGQVLEALREAADTPLALQTPAPAASVKEYGECAIEYQLFVWAETKNFWDAKCHILEEIKSVFDQKGIEMSYPHINVHMDK